MNVKQKKIFIIINDLGGGGAEKILFDTIQHVDKNKYRIDVCTIFDNGVYDKGMESCVHKFDSLYSLTKYPVILRRLMKFMILRKIKWFTCKSLLNKIKGNDYDIEISFLEGPATKVLSYPKSNAKKLAWVHVDPIVLPYSTKYFRSLTQEIEAYKKYDKILCVSSEVRESFIKKYGIKNNVSVQFNVLDERNVIEKASKGVQVNFIQENTFKIVSIGRLMSQKSYDRLLKVVLRLHNDFKNFQLIVLGEGNERKKLEKFIQDNNMSQYVCLYGFSDNPYAILSTCDLFICSSLTEGFSTVVTEAVILGIPVLTTNCAGMRDILGDSEYGMIVDNDEHSLYKGLYHVLSDEKVYYDLQAKVRKRKEFFNIDVRIQELENLFDND